MKKITLITFILLSFLAQAQVPTPTGYLTQNAKWKFTYKPWFTSGAYFSGLTKMSGQNRVLVYDSVTNIVGYKYITSSGAGTVTSVSGTSPVTVATGTTTPVISMAAATTSVDGYLTATNWNTFNNKQATLSLTTTGSSGAATLVGNTLNVPQYSGGASLDSLKLWRAYGNTILDGQFLGSTNNRSMRFRTNNTLRGRLDSMGLFSLGEPTAARRNDSRFSLKGQGATSSTNVMYAENSAGAHLLSLNNVGSLGLGTNTPDKGGFGVRTLTIDGASDGFSVFNMVGTGNSGADMGIIDWYNNTTRIAEFEVQADGTNGGAWKFWLKKDGGSLTNIMTIRNDGLITYPTTVTAAGTTGAQTINKLTGTVNIAAAGTSVVVTNSLVSVNSIITCVLRTNDATARIANVVAAAGSFTINIVACTSEVSVGFKVTN